MLFVIKIRSQKISGQTFRISLSAQRNKLFQLKANSRVGNHILLCKKIVVVCLTKIR